MVLLIGMVGCSAEDFEDTFYPGGEVPSPDGRLIATFYGLGGGGAAGWLSESVTVRQSSTPFDQSQARRALWMGYAYEICLDWDSDEHLVISIPSGAIIHEQKSSLAIGRPIAISVVELPRGSIGKFKESCLGTKLELQTPNADNTQK